MASAWGRCSASASSTTAWIRCSRSSVCAPAGVDSVAAHATSGRAVPPPDDGQADRAGAGVDAEDLGVEHMFDPKPTPPVRATQSHAWNLAPARTGRGAVSRPRPGSPRGCRSWRRRPGRRRGPPAPRSSRSTDSACRSPTGTVGLRNHRQLGRRQRHAGLLERLADGARACRARSRSPTARRRRSGRRRRPPAMISSRRSSSGAVALSSLDQAAAVEHPRHAPRVAHGSRRPG